MKLVKNKTKKKHSCQKFAHAAQPLRPSFSISVYEFDMQTLFVKLQLGNCYGALEINILRLFEKKMYWLVQGNGFQSAFIGLEPLEV